MADFEIFWGGCRNESSYIDYFHAISKTAVGCFDVKPPVSDFAREVRGRKQTVTVQRFIILISSASKVTLVKWSVVKIENGRCKFEKSHLSAWRGSIKVADSFENDRCHILKYPLVDGFWIERPDSQLKIDYLNDWSSNCAVELDLHGSREIQVFSST